jgi:hypothetical protein
MPANILDKVKVKNQHDVTKYAVLLGQAVWGSNMPIIGSIINKYLPLLGGHTWKAAWVVQRWAAGSEHYLEDVAT